MAQVNCTQCGAGVTVQGDGFVHCGSCQAALYVDTSRLWLHQQIAPLVEANEVAGRIRRWLHGREVPGEVRVESMQLQRWPFWEVEVQGRRTLMLAAPSMWPELEALDLSTGAREPFDDSARGEVIEPSRYAEAALRRALPETAALRADPARARIRLIHVPLYTARYRLRGDESKRTWDALVDGIAGGVYAESTPVPSTSQLDHSHAKLFAITAAVFIVEGLILPGTGWTLLGYTLTGFALYHIYKNFVGELK